jgi:hypothetical protein
MVLVPSCSVRFYNSAREGRLTVGGGCIGDPALTQLDMCTRRLLQLLVRDSGSKDLWK